MGGISLGFSKLPFSRFSGGSFLVLDIGTYSAKALLISKTGKDFAVAGYSAKPYISDIYTDEGIDASVILSASRGAIRDLSGGFRHRLPKKVILGIGGGFLHGKTLTQNYIRDNASEEIEEGEFSNIIQKVQQRIYEQIRRDFARETARSELEVRLIGSDISDFKIDGYQVVNPIGFKGKEIAVSIFNSYAAKTNIEVFERIIEDLKLDLLSIISEPYAVFNASGTESLKDAIFIDMGGGVTEVTLVRKGKLEDTRAIAIGGSSFTKSISESLKISDKEAETIKQVTASEGVSDRVAKKLDSIIKKDMQFFLEGLQVVLSDLSHVLILPSSINLYGGGASVPIAHKMLSQKKWTGKLSFFSKPKVSKLLVGKDKISYDDDALENILWTSPMSLANFYINRDASDDVSKILRRTLRLIQQR